MISFNIVQRRNLSYLAQLSRVVVSPRDFQICFFAGFSVLLSSMGGSLPSFQGATHGSLPGWGFYFPRAWFFRRFSAGV